MIHTSHRILKIIVGLSLISAAISETSFERMLRGPKASKVPKSTKKPYTQTDERMLFNIADLMGKKVNVSKAPKSTKKPKAQTGGRRLFDIADLTGKRAKASKAPKATKTPKGGRRRFI